MIISQKLNTTELLFRCAAELGLEPVWLVKGSLFAVSTPNGERYIHYAKSALNPQLSSSITGNKLATRAVLEHNGLPSIPYCKPANHEQAAAFLATHKKIIVKPLRGSNSHDVHIVTTPEQMQHMAVQGYICEKYIAGTEIRYLLLNNEVIGVHESQYGESVAEDRPLQRISYRRSQWDPALILLSLEVANVMGLRYAAVDYLIDAAGKAHILEVNSSPGMKWFHAPSSGPAIDVARLFLEAMLDSTPTVTREDTYV